MQPADIGSIINAIVGRVSSLIPSLKDTVDEVGVNLAHISKPPQNHGWSLTMHAKIPALALLTLLL